MFVLDESEARQLRPVALYSVVVGVAVEFASRHLRNQKPDLWSMQEVSGGPTPDTYGVSFDL